MRRGPRRGPLAAALLALALGACDGLLEVDLPGNLTEDALRDPRLAEVLVTSAVGNFECGLVDMWYPGQWMEEFQNTSTGRPNALAQFRSQLLGVYVDPCSSGTGPIWTTLQVPRQDARRAIEFIRAMTFTPLTLPDTTFLIAKARLYEGYSIQLLAESFCAVTFDGGPLVTREAAYDSSEVKFTEAMTLGLTVIGARATEAAAIVNAARVGRARSRLYQWQYAGGAAADVIADASAVTLTTFQFNATYDGNPTRRRNRLFTGNNEGRNFIPYSDYTNLRLDTASALPSTRGLHRQGGTVGVADPRVRIAISTSTTDLDGRGLFPMRRQTKYPARGSPIPFSTYREARLMIAEVDPTQSLAIINGLRTSSSGVAASILANFTQAAPLSPTSLAATPWPLPTISAATWAALTPAQRVTAVREERRRELWMQGTQAGDKIRWGYPAWDAADEYGQPVRDITLIDDPLTTGPETRPPGPTGPTTAQGCMPIPYLEKTSNPFLIAITGS